jgi:hypothetical protein
MPTASVLGAILATRSAGRKGGRAAGLHRDPGQPATGNSCQPPRTRPPALVKPGSMRQALAAANLRPAKGEAPTRGPVAAQIWGICARSAVGEVHPMPIRIRRVLSKGEMRRTATPMTATSCMDMFKHA